MQSWLPNPYRVVIIGSGLSGLSAAQTLLRYSKVPCQIKIVESAPNVGGWLSSSRFEDGLVMEHGPRTARSYGPVALKALDIISELDIDDQIIGITKATGGKRYVFVNEEICQVQLLKSIFRTQKPFSKPLLSCILQELRTGKSRLDEDLSITDFLERRFNSEVAMLSTAICRGIFGGDTSKLSFKSCFPLIYKHEQNHGSIVKVMFKSMFKGMFTKSNGAELLRKATDEKWIAWTLKNGIQTLPELWSENLKESGAEVLVNSKCSKISFKSDNRVEVLTDDGSVHECERVISAVPTFQLSSLMDSYHSRFIDLLNSINYTNMAVVTLEYKNGQLPIEGFGILVPSSEPCEALGITFDSHVIPQHTPKGSTVLTVMAGGAQFHDLFGCPSTADTKMMEELAVRTVREMLGISGTPCRIVSRVQRQCIPQYELGHARRVEQMNNYVLSNNLPLTMVGTHDGGVGVNDAIVNARNTTLKWLSSNHMY